ncbi:MAG TPA: hypothetical protein VJ779_14965 [Acetobacteraceae bacterium]|nr:hypothetical protein [Acetobacteraceae bacterium]
MTGLLLLLTIIAVTWLCVWSARADGPAKWSPFDIREHQQSTPSPAAAPKNARAAAAPRERQWKRSGS